MAEKVERIIDVMSDNLKGVIECLSWIERFAEDMTTYHGEPDVGMIVKVTTTESKFEAMMDKLYHEKNCSYATEYDKVHDIGWLFVFNETEP